MRLEFGEFAFDSATREVLRGAEAVHLSPKAFQLLLMLIERRPAAISKQDLQSGLWPDTFVSEANLGVLVAEIRSALGDNAREPRFIRTVYGFGYAFCGDNEPVEEPAVPVQPKRRIPVAPSIAIAAVIAFAGVYGISRYTVRDAPAPNRARRPIDPRAREAWVKGCFFREKSTPDDVSTAMKYFKEAASRDPNYADAYVGIAKCYNELGFFAVLLPADAFPAARAAARKALDLDPSKADAYSTLAWCEALYDWDNASADRHFRKGLDVNPNDAEVHSQYSIFLAGVDRGDDAVRHVRRAIELAPASSVSRRQLPFVLYLGRHYDESIAQYKKVIELDPGDYGAYERLGDAYAAAGRDNDAFVMYQKWAAAAGMPEDTLNSLRNARQSGGMKAYWRKRLELENAEALDSGDVWPYRLASLSVRAGDVDGAFAWLERAFAEHASRMFFISVDPVFDPVRTDERYVALKRRINSVAD